MRTPAQPHIRSFVSWRSPLSKGPSLLKTFTSRLRTDYEEEKRAKGMPLESDEVPETLGRGQSRPRSSSGCYFVEHNARQFVSLIAIGMFQLNIVCRWGEHRRGRKRLRRIVLIWAALLSSRGQRRP